MAYLVLENGAVFKGRQFGYSAEAVGELVFSTAMTGYMETLTNPGYSGQIVLQTFPLIGNYGWIPAEGRSDRVQLNAYIVREWCQEPSNFRSEGNLDSFLCENKIPGLYNIDTRALTRIIRESGKLRAVLSHSPELTEAQRESLKGNKSENSVEKVLPGFAAGKVNSDEKKNGIIVWNFGDNAIVREFENFGCKHVMAVGCAAAADEILAMSPGGVVLSDGPENPAESAEIIEVIKKLCDKKVPIFGIGLGHQLLAIARGAKVEKLPVGHRGANQPVREKKTGRAFVTGQAHGYAVSADSLPKTAKVSYEHTIDGTCEGIDYTDIPAFSVQFRPTPDADIFGKFVKMIEKGV